MSKVDYTAGRFWFDILQFLVICIIGIYSWWINRKRVTNERFKEHHLRLTALEKHVGKVPTQEQYDVMSGKIALLHGDLKEIKGQLKGINRAVDLMNEYLINNGGKN